MIIAFDIDGVLARLDDAWFARYNQDYNDNLTHDKVSDWDTSKFVKKACGKKIFDYLKDPSLYDEVLPYEDAYEVVTELRSMGHRIIFPTTTPIESSGAKYYWLQRYNLLDDPKDYIEVSDKTLVRADVLLDDKYENYNDFPDFAVLMLQPWNIKFLLKETDNFVLSLTEFKDNLLTYKYPVLSYNYW